MKSSPCLAVPLDSALVSASDLDPGLDPDMDRNIPLAPSWGRARERAWEGPGAPSRRRPQALPKPRPARLLSRATAPQVPEVLAFLLSPENGADSDPLRGLSPFIRRHRRALGLTKTLFWILAAVGMGLGLGRLT